MWDRAGMFCVGHMLKAGYVKHFLLKNELRVHMLSFVLVVCARRTTFSPSAAAIQYATTKTSSSRWYCSATSKPVRTGELHLQSVSPAIRTYSTSSEPVAPGHGVPVFSGLPVVLYRRLFAPLSTGSASVELQLAKCMFNIQTNKDLTVNSSQSLLYEYSICRTPQIPITPCVETETPDTTRFSSRLVFATRTARFYTTIRRNQNIP
jgi:hypothetical protein